MAATFLILAFVAILSTQALVEAQHEDGKGHKDPDRTTERLRRLLGKLQNTKLHECVKAESQSFIDLYTSTVDRTKKCAQQSDIQEALKKLQTQYDDDSLLIKSLCTDIKGCNANEECIINVVKTKKPELAEAMNMAGEAMKYFKSAFKGEEKKCFKKVRTATDARLKKISESVKDCSEKTSTA